MNLLDLLIHALNFVAAAAFLAALMPLVGRLTMPRQLSLPAVWRQTVINFAVCSITLLAGLAIFGRDGKLATYVALVAACASSQWLMCKAWVWKST